MNDWNEHVEHWMLDEEDLPRSCSITYFQDLCEYLEQIDLDSYELAAAERNELAGEIHFVLQDLHLFSPELEAVTIHFFAASHHETGAAAGLEQSGAIYSLLHVGSHGIYFSFVRLPSSVHLPLRPTHPLPKQSPTTARSSSHHHHPTPPSKRQLPEPDNHPTPHRPPPCL